MNAILGILVGIVISVSQARGQWIEWPAVSGGNGHSYLPVAVASPISWDHAFQAARELGGYLATITSDAENAFVYHLVEAPQFWAGAPGVILGGYQPTGSPEPAGGWTWVTGEPWSYSNWSNLDNGDSPSEDGLTFLPGGTWNDKNTSKAQFFGYVVERESPCTPRKAKATAQLVNGFVVGATITDGGCGYTNPPTVLIQGGGGNGALARAIVSEGRVTEIRISDAGCCYTDPPRVVIGSPSFVPTVAIEVSRINVIQNVVLGWKYVLESSTNAVNWMPTGPPFVADSESIVTEFIAEPPGRLFRLRVVP